jgi:hypothetical protein
MIEQTFFYLTTLNPGVVFEGTQIAPTESGVPRFLLESETEVLVAYGNEVEEVKERKEGKSGVTQQA